MERKKPLSIGAIMLRCKKSEERACIANWGRETKAILLIIVMELLLALANWLASAKILHKKFSSDTINTQSWNLTLRHYWGTMKIQLIIPVPLYILQWTLTNPKSMGPVPVQIVNECIQLNGVQSWISLNWVFGLVRVWIKGVQISKGPLYPVGELLPSHTQCYCNLIKPDSWDRLCPRNKLWKPQCTA